MRALWDRLAHSRLALCAAVLSLCVTLPLLAEQVSGPEPVGAAATKAPVVTAGVVSPSPQTSPGAIQRIAVDSTGAVYTRSTTSGSPLPVYLPASSPVPVTQSASSTATGVNLYCAPQFAGGSAGNIRVTPSPCNVYNWCGSNPNTSDVYVEFFDSTSPTLGTTAPVRIEHLPPGLGASNRGWNDGVFNPPLTFSTAMTIAVVTTANGSTAPTSNVTLNAGWK